MKFRLINLLNYRYKLTWMMCVCSWHYYVVEENVIYNCNGFENEKLLPQLGWPFYRFIFIWFAKWIQLKFNQWTKKILFKFRQFHLFFATHYYSKVHRSNHCCPNITVDGVECTVKFWIICFKNIGTDERAEDTDYLSQITTLISSYFWRKTSKFWRKTA